MLKEMPNNAIFQFVEFALISSHFGIFPHEEGIFIKEWIKKLQSRSLSIQ